MKNIGRNAPCPCGSGRKYKHCCYGKKDNIIPFPGTRSEHGFDFMPDEDFSPTFMEGMGTPNPATEELKKLQQFLKDHEPASEEEFRALLGHFQQQESSRGIADFLGLSPDQMHRIIHGSIFEAQQDILVFDPGITPEDLGNMPALNQLYQLLVSLSRQEPLKATTKGNLPRAFVQEIYTAHYEQADSFPQNIRKESDAFVLSVHRRILELAGLIKLRKQYYSLTRKGRDSLSGTNLPVFFGRIISCYLREFNWGYSDGYAEMSIIQFSALFSLYVLHKKARRFIPGSELGDIFLNAFPNVLAEVEESFTTPEEYTKSAFSLRFLERFCLAFGLVERRETKQEPEYSRATSCLYKVTPLFDRLFQWKV